MITILTGLGLAAVSALSSVCARAETDATSTVEGIVEIRGSSINKKTYIKSQDGVSLALCKGRLSEKVGQISGMEISLKGKLTIKSKKRNCFAAASFQVLKTGSGNSVVTGKLVTRGSGLGIQLNNTTVKLSSPIPAGLSDKIGKEVMIVLAQKSAFSLNDESISAASFLEFKNTPTKESSFND